MLVKYPPATIAVPLMASAVIQPSAFGSQDVARPETASMAAMKLRGWPPMLLKLPPA